MGLERWSAFSEIGEVETQIAAPVLACYHQWRARLSFKMSGTCQLAGDRVVANEAGLFLILRLSGYPRMLPGKVRLISMRSLVAIENMKATYRGKLECPSTAPRSLTLRK